jgi:hypothetical protein
MDRMRISCASLAKVELNMLFLMEFKTGNPRYVPFCGATEFYENVRPFLSSLGAEFENGKIEEVKNGYTNMGAKIADNCLALLD